MKNYFDMEDTGLLDNGWIAGKGDPSLKGKLSQKQRDCLEKAEGITITTNPRPESVPETFSNLYRFSTKIIARLYEENLTLKENTEISCKDSASGLSLPKVKTGSGHWKPFYQTNKY